MLQTGDRFSIINFTLLSIHTPFEWYFSSVPVACTRYSAFSPSIPCNSNQSRAMQHAKTYTVRRLGVPVGTVTLDANELISAGVLNVLPGYASIRETVRDGSVALLNLGFFGRRVTRIGGWQQRWRTRTARGGAAGVRFD